MARERAKDFVGTKINRLLILDTYTRDKKTYAKCLCDCGVNKDIRFDSIKSGVIVSCGCYARESTISRFTKHGRHGSAEYSSWQHMKERCKPSSAEYYPHHAGKGITVCRDWENSFENFYRDMGDCPKGFSLDRIDSSLNYCKENCRWVDTGMQGFNKDRGRISGVRFRDEKGKWTAYINRDGVRYSLGSYETYDEAVAARLEAELYHYGEHNAKNFMRDFNISLDCESNTTKDVETSVCPSDTI